MYWLLQKKNPHARVRDDPNRVARFIEEQCKLIREQMNEG